MEESANGLCSKKATIKISVFKYVLYMFIAHVKIEKSSTYVVKHLCATTECRSSRVIFSLLNSHLLCQQNEKPQIITFSFVITNLLHHTLYIEDTWLSTFLLFLIFLSVVILTQQYLIV